jgi:hypothetical protein
MQNIFMLVHVYGDSFEKINENELGTQRGFMPISKNVQ